MDELKIEYLKPSDLKPYENNPRNNDNAVEYVMNSIREFGFKVPLVIDRNNIIVCGHTRWKAARKLRKKMLPCIRADDLTDEQIKAFRIADNKVSELATWVEDKLEIELGEISLDMGAFGFDLEDIEVNTDSGDDADGKDDEGYYGDERERTNKAYNLDLVDPENLTRDFWQMPIIRRENFIPGELIGFNYALTSDNKNAGIHFYVDDYQFERLWNEPEKYVDVLAAYDCILSPDFSLYLDMPMPIKIWNIYRSRQIGAYYQSQGIKVIPTVSWAEPETFEFCFQGIEEGSVVSISTIGVKRDKNALKIWREGVAEMLDRIKPSAVLIYGGKLDFDFGKVKTVYYENRVTEKWRSVDKASKGV